MFGKRNKAPTRDLGLRQNGKGSADRTTNVSLFRDNFGEIQWDLTRPDMVQRGQRLVRIYR